MKKKFLRIYDYKFQGCERKTFELLKMWPDFTEYLLDFNLLVSDSISLIEINSNIFYPPWFLARPL